MATSGPSVLTQAETTNLVDNAVIFVRGRRAVIQSVDFPLVYWKFDGVDVIKHRSFIADRTQFQVMKTTPVPETTPANAESSPASSPPTVADTSATTPVTESHEEKTALKTSQPVDKIGMVCRIVCLDLASWF